MVYGAGAGAALWPPGLSADENLYGGLDFDTEVSRRSLTPWLRLGVCPLAVARVLSSEWITVVNSHDEEVR